MKNYKKRLESGVTLVELAIVLVIIGLLVAGVLQGQTLIKQAKIRNVVAKFAEYDTAANTFRAKYDNEIPGDYTQASVMGLNAPTALADTAATDDNGDGDGDLESEAQNTHEAFNGEVQNFWIMLSNAGLVQGSYEEDADSGTGFPEAQVGTGIIAVSSTLGVQYAIGVPSTVAITGTNFNAQAGAEDDALAGNTLSPEDAYAIDTKVDDGKPLTGATQVFDTYDATGLFTNATTSGSEVCVSADDVYNIAAQAATPLCSIRVKSAI